MFRPVAVALLVSVCVPTATGAARAFAAEPIAPGAAQAHRAPTAADVQLSQYLYVEFPRCLEALAREKQLAEAELQFIARRVESYRPFRSFKHYSPAYTADQSWQIAFLAAQQRLQLLQDAEADLWRQRRTVVAAVQGRNAAR